MRMSQLAALIALILATLAPAPGLAAKTVPAVLDKASQPFHRGVNVLGYDPYWTDGFGPVHAHPNLWPAGVPEFRPAITAYWRAMEELSVKLQRVFALALDLGRPEVIRRVAVSEQLRINEPAPLLFLEVIAEEVRPY